MIDIENLRVNFENKALNSGRLVIIPHKLADFDAIGSAIGLSLAAKKLKKDSIVYIKELSAPEGYHVDPKPVEVNIGLHQLDTNFKECESSSRGQRG